MEPDKTVKELIDSGRQALSVSCFDCNQADAETLMGHVLEMDRAKLFLHQDLSVGSEKQECYENLVARVALGEPLQYVLGETYFMGHRFAVDNSVLIPRPETEILCEMAIHEFRAFGEAPVALDMCTGSGILAISIARAVEDARITASDISDAALLRAAANARDLGVSSRIKFCRSNLFEALYIDSAGKRPRELYNLIVTNPPYIKTSDLRDLPHVVREHEPVIALDGGASGLDFYNHIAEESGAFLNSGGVILAEIGADQGAQVKAAFEAAGFSEVSVSIDLAGRDRVARAVKR